MKKISDIIKDSNYSFSLFDPALVQELEEKIVIKENKPYAVCAIRDKEILLKPEEVVRQLYLMKLIKEYGYPKRRIALERAIYFGREVKSADIVIFDRDRPDTEYIIIEVKKPKLQDGKSQLRSYTHATGAPIAVWTNGGQISYYNRKDPNYFEDITNIPKADQTLEDILKERFTFKDLILKDKIPNEGKTLKTIIQEMEDEVLANAGVDVFEEVFKLIFTKLYDEYKSGKDRENILYFLATHKSPVKVADSLGEYGVINSREISLSELREKVSLVDDTGFRVLEFRNSGQADIELKEKIQHLFDRAKEEWPGVFEDASKIQLSSSHLAICVASLQDVKLFNSNLQVVDEAFEYLVNKSSKGEKGQYFTPRHVIDMCVKMLNPQAGEYMVDTAAGSCGFTVHTIFYIKNYLEEAGIVKEEKEYISKIFGIDFDEKVVRIARTLNLIAGDGNTNVLHLNNLDYDRWSESVNCRNWWDVYGAGFKRLEALRRDPNSYKEFNFDILMANPPFAGDIKEPRIIHKYDLGYNEKQKPKPKVGRDILFIERNLDFLKPGGRMAVVLPQGRFNNSSDKDIREYIAERARILAVVGLNVNTFKPHTGTKTSVLFLQKWNDKPELGPLCPKVENYPIFFAVSEKSGKDNSGEYVFVKNSEGQMQFDIAGHAIIDHDLYNLGDMLQEGIAEKFIKWAKDEKLSFWR